MCQDICTMHIILIQKRQAAGSRKESGTGCQGRRTSWKLKDYFGNVIEEIRLKEDAIILYQTISYSVPENSPLIAYGHYDTCIDDLGDMNHEHTHEELHKHHKEHYDDHAGIHSREMWEDMI